MLYIHVSYVIHKYLCNILYQRNISGYYKAYIQRYISPYNRVGAIKTATPATPATRAVVSQRIFKDTCYARSQSGSRGVCCASRSKILLFLIFF